MVPRSINKKKTEVSRIPSLLFSRLSKTILDKSKFYKKNQSANGNNRTYTQASKNNVDNIIKIKDTFSKLLAKKIIEIHDIVNSKEKKNKLKLNMTTKNPSRKQVIILISSNNFKAIISQAN